MKNIKSSLFLILLISRFSVFAADGEYPKNVASTIKMAENSRLEAKHRGFEWSTTSILIRKAKEAAKNGNQPEAMVLADKALKEAKNSIKQADYAAKNWQKFAL